jgi:hypothetical protein
MFFMGYSLTLISTTLKIYNLSINHIEPLIFSRIKNTGGRGYSVSLTADGHSLCKLSFLSCPRGNGLFTQIAYGSDCGARA